MLTIPWENRSSARCDGLTRRGLLKAGMLGGVFALPDLLRLKSAAAEAGKSTPDTAVILIWLDGGPSQVDTYDPKPETSAEIRGPFGTTRTNVPGIIISDQLPHQAKVMDKMSIIRSVSHATSDHKAGTAWMLSGYFGPTEGKPHPTDPSIASITSKVRGPNVPGLPAYVSVPFEHRQGMPRGYHGAAYLGSSYDSFETGGDPNAADFRINNLRLPSEISLERLENRRNLRASFDTLRREIDNSAEFRSLDKFQREAIELVSGTQAQQAFDLAQEDPALRDKYGRNTWGQSALMARRLVEKGVTFVTVLMPDWDDHDGIEPRLKMKLPKYDQALAALLTDLSDRGLNQKVLVYVCGEFGRTPRITSGAGRDHWGKSGFALMAGGGLKMGQVIGSTTTKGEEPKDKPLGPADMLATVYRFLGIDTTQQFIDNAGRPHPILNAGQPIAELF